MSRDTPAYTRDEAMLAIARALNASLTMETAVQHVLELVGETLSADAVSVFVRDTESDEGDDLQVSFARRGGAIEHGVASIALGLSGFVLQTGKAVLVDDVAKEPRFAGKLDAQFGTRTRSLLAVPMRRRERLNGLIEAIRERPEPFDHSDLEFLSGVADELAVAVENALLVHRLTEQVHEREILLDAARAVSGSLRLDEVTSTLLTTLEKVVPYDAVGVYLFDRKSRALIDVEHRGYPPSVAGMLSEQPGRGITGWVAKNRQSLNIGDVRSDPRYLEVRPATRSEVAVPLVRADDVIGVITIESDEPDAYSDRQVALLEIFAEHVASAITNARLHEQQRERARLDYEIELSRDIQRAALPAPTLSGEGFEAAGVNVASDVVGGDYFDYFVRTDGKLGLALVDVAGHGLSAALLMQAVRSAIRLTLDSMRSPAILLQRIARLLHESTPANKFVAMVLARLDVTSGRLAYANGGHIPPLRIGRDKTSTLKSTGFILGAFPDSKYKGREMQLERGDLLVFYTDGLTELRNRAGEEFGVERLVELVREHREEPLEQIINLVRRRARAFRQGGEREDDITLMLVRWTGQ
ncbi:MAG: SpoIIE family protein phosphatase [Acidobacteriota bacterium]|jgi:sigma-B regulation protein RsbU (phosphoserine phosphatase)